MDADELSGRLLEFAVRTMDLVEALPHKKTATHCANQLLRSGTSPGANYEEAIGAESREDFIHKCAVVLKELRESRYWLRVVLRKEFVRAERLTALVTEADELVRIFSKTVSTTRSRRHSPCSRNESLDRPSM